MLLMPVFVGLGVAAYAFLQSRPARQVIGLAVLAALAVLAIEVFLSLPVEFHSVQSTP